MLHKKTKMPKMPESVKKMYDALKPFEDVIQDYDYIDTPYQSTGIDDKSLIGIDALKRAALARHLARRDFPQLRD